MAKNGYRILDSDMHVFEPHDLYLKYMNPKWGDRVPRGEPRRKHGQMHFRLVTARRCGSLACRRSLTAS